MQGRFKRDGSAAADQEPRGGIDRGSSPQHAQNHGPAANGANDSDITPAKPKAKNRLKGKSGKNAGGSQEMAPGGDKAKGQKGKDESIPKAPSGPGSRLAMQNWRISTRLVSLLALPVVAATTLGGFRISESLSDIQQLEHMQLLTTMTKQATALAAALQEERDRTAGPLSNDTRNASTSLVKGVRTSTDDAVSSFTSATDGIDGGDESDETLDSIRGNIVQITRQLGTIEETRKNAYVGGSQRTVSEYNSLITSLLSLSQDMAQATSSPEMIKRTRALAAFSAAKEYASIQRAVIAAALPKDDKRVGSLSDNDRLYGLSAYENEEQAMQTFELVYQGRAEDLTNTLGSGNTEIASAELYAKRVLSNTGQLPREKDRSWLDWYDADDNKIRAMQKIELQLLDDMEIEARKLKNESQQDALINGALILLVLGVSLVGAFVVARSMIRSLRRLQDTATRVAQDRLPELVKALSEADPQDVDTSVESVGINTRDEIGKVAAAFDDVHREAVRLAAEQALLRGNVNAMFTNLSRRSQGLIQRQLSLISELESREADPDQLSSLFKLDHLATRMRRNGENLLVLAGEEPGRRWTRPVPLVDVLRAAASEVEQYERIELASVPATEVAGRVVNDLVHLLAELLENATSFSSPQTKVRVTGHALPDGRVLVEIHDTGIGLSPEDLAAINERLASPPTVDVSVSRRMGLFVVGRLSLRHGIRIQLRPSDSGGTTALVMLPVDVAQGGKRPATPAAGVPGGQQPAPAGPRPGGAPQGSAASRLAAGAGAARGQVPSGGQRAALPGRDGGARPQGPGGQGGFGGGNAFGADSPLNAPQDRQSPAPAGGRQSGQGGKHPDGQGGGFGAPNPNAFQRPQAPAAPVPTQAAAPEAPQERQLPPRGQRAELPGEVPQTTSWGTGADAPRGHDDRPEAAATAEFPRPDFNAPAPQGNSTTGQFQRPDVRGPLDPSTTGQFPSPQYGAPAPQGNSTTGQFQRPDVRGPLDPSTSGQFTRPDLGAQDPAATGHFARPDFGAPRPAAGQGAGYPQQGQGNQPDLPQAPQRSPQESSSFAPVPARQSEALPPAQNTGDGRTPLFDGLESDWQHGQGGSAQQRGPAARQGQQGYAPQAPSAPQPTPPHTAPAAQPPARREPAGDALTATGSTQTVSWRQSPNDELGRQAERIRQPAAGGITTSGLPKRVPRANLVAGTAQEQAAQSGPQVSRAPDDVRGRLTNLRRGIQQGRQAGNGGPATGSYRIGGPSHQQER
ncbi:nitrate- and nitrite sensing domain-containing protein [Streptomyces sp. NPDC006879]|uniref:sensor histidine kinase n=1 Tax=Streptomyces sp. NPDC006879 TaxID=3364767 RepID=UPI003682DB04